ncbi:hypothetical protein Tco_0614513 [Tanacetum coccineum]
MIRDLIRLRIEGKIRGEVGGEGLVASIACDDKELVVMGDIGGVLLGGGDGSEEGRLIAGKIRGEVGGEGLVASIACEGDDKELVVMGDIGGVLLGGGDGSEEGRL